jgi:hypothetical protein
MSSHEPAGSRWDFENRTRPKPDNSKLRGLERRKDARDKRLARIRKQARG